MSKIRVPRGRKVQSDDKLQDLFEIFLISEELYHIRYRTRFQTKNIKRNWNPSYTIF